MAELVIKIGTTGPDPQYQDSDIICAFNDDRIKCVHAENICHPKFVTKNGDGLLPAGDVCEDFFIHTAEFKFLRISDKEIKRIKLSDMSEEVISDIFNAKGEYMNVPEFIKRRVKHARHRIFGTAGNEYWYGGNRTVNSTRLAIIWGAIEAKTVKLESDHTRWPLTIREQKLFLVVPTDDFDGDTARDMVLPVMDNTDPENPIMLKKRNQQVNWETDVAGISADTIAKIKNVAIPIDLRKFANQVRTDIVKVKA